LPVFIVVDDGIGYAVIFYAVGGIEHAEFHAGGEESFNGDVDLPFGDHFFGGGFFEVGIGVEAFEVAAGSDGEYGGRVRGGNNLMALVDIVDGAAVRDDIAPEAPFVSKDGGEQAAAAAAGLAIEAVVGAHDGEGFPFPDAHFKLREVGLAKVAFVRSGVEKMAFRFGAAMDGEVFDGGDGLEIFRIVARKGSSP
jgi:hypothetical protein